MSLAVTLTGAASATAISVDGVKRTRDWDFEGTEASSPMIANGAELGAVTMEASGEPGEFSFAGSNSTTDAYPAVSATTTTAAECSVGTKLNEPKNCGVYATLTITFPQAMVNPVLLMQVTTAVGKSGESATNPDWCTRSWSSAQITSVNGAVTDAGSTHLLNAEGAKYVWDETTSNLSPPTTVVTGSECAIYGSDWVRIGIPGTVTSVEVEISLWGMTTSYSRSTPALAVPGLTAVQPLFPVADLSVTTSAPARVDSGDSVEWKVNVKNLGAADSHGFIVRDAVPAEASDVSVVSAPDGCTLTGRDLVCLAAPEDCEISQNQMVSTLANLSCTNMRDADAVVLGSGKSLDTITLAGTVTAERGTVVTNRAEIAGVDLDSDTKNNTGTVDTIVERPTLTVRTEVEERQSASDQFVVEVNTASSSFITPVSITSSAVAATATTGTETSATTETVQVVRGRQYVITESMAEGSVSDQSLYRTELVCVAGEEEPVVIDGPGPTWTFTPTSDLDYVCTINNIPLGRSYSVVKTVSAGIVRPGDQVDYQIVITNTGETPYTESDPATFTDDLSEVLDDASFVEVTSGNAEFDGQTLQWSGALPVGESVEVAYTVLVDADPIGDLSMRNTVVTPADTGGDCPAASPAPSCSTATEVTLSAKRVWVEKVASDDTQERLEGAQFDILADADGEPGDALPGTAGTETDTGLFAFDLEPGTYWLRETKAPDGYSLLAEPVRFSVSDTGEVGLTDPGLAPQVTVRDGDVLTVTDLPQLHLPYAGGHGQYALYLVGAMLVMLAAAAWTIRAKRPDARRAL